MEEARASSVRRRASAASSRSLTEVGGIASSADVLIGAYRLGIAVPQTLQVEHVRKALYNLGPRLIDRDPLRVYRLGMLMEIRKILGVPRSCRWYSGGKVHSLSLSGHLNICILRTFTSCHSFSSFKGYNIVHRVRTIAEQIRASQVLLARQLRLEVDESAICARPAVYRT